jgi:hypothetical protein
VAGFTEAAVLGAALLEEGAGAGAGGGGERRRGERKGGACACTAPNATKDGDFRSAAPPAAL